MDRVSKSPSSLAAAPNESQVQLRGGPRRLEDGTQPPAPFLVEVDAIAAALRVSKWAVYRWAKAGQIPCIRAGRKVRFVLEEVVAALRVDAKLPVPTKEKRGSAPLRATRGRQPEPARPAPTVRASAPPSTATAIDPNERLRAAIAATRALRD